MIDHEWELKERCNEVVYLKGGALCMKKEQLENGEKCHRDIAEYNLSKQGPEEVKPCYQCGSAGAADVSVTVDGTEKQGSLLVNEDKNPEWYKCAGLEERLPPQFEDIEYETLVPHDVEDGSLYKLDISNSDIDANAYIGVWASEPSSSILPAHEAYGEFTNSALAKCEENMCTFRIKRPTSYTTNGKVYKPHIHLVEHDGVEWSQRIRTLTLAS